MPSLQMSFPCLTLFQIIAGVDRNVGVAPVKKEKMLSMGKHFRLKRPDYRISKVFGSGFSFVWVDFQGHESSCKTIL